jgi:glycosyltransferase involved in cell wall biosynthesis
MIIVNDRSTDSSLQIAEQYAQADPRIKIVNHTHNMGISAARNASIAHAKGHYIAFIDSDDIWKNDKLEKQISFMQGNGYLFTYTACELIDEGGEPMNKTMKPRASVNYKQLLKSNCIVCSSVMIDTDKIKVHVPPVKHEDYATWLDILKNGHTAYAVAGGALTEYRIRKSSVSANKFKALSWVYNIYRNHLKMPLVQALWRLAVYFFYSAAKYSNALGAVFKKK